MTKQEQSERIAAGLAEWQKLQDGHVPGSKELDDAPILTDWGISGDALVGLVTGHPRLEDGKLIMTSPLLAIDLDMKWARTVSRYYQLGHMRGEPPR